MYAEVKPIILFFLNKINKAVIITVITVTMAMCPLRSALSLAKVPHNINALY